MKAKRTKLDPTTDAYVEYQVHRIANFEPAPFQFKGKPSRKDTPLDEIPPIGKQQEFITRDQCRIILGGCCLYTVAKLERAGKFKGKHINKQNERSTSKKLYRKADVIAYAAGRD